MNPTQAAVKEFHQKFGLTVGDTPAVRDAELRAALIVEEAIETAAALMLLAHGSKEVAYWKLRGMVVNAVGAVEKLPDDPDALFAEVIDGICDTKYVLDGSGVVFGVDLDPFFFEVHRSNMAKEGGPMRADGKILKPEGWEPPRIVEMLRDLKANSLHVYEFEHEHFIAYSEADALDLYAEYYRGEISDDDLAAALEDGCVRVDDDKTIRVFWDKKRDLINDSGETLDLTAAEWTKKIGRGFLCTSQL